MRSALPRLSRLVRLAGSIAVGTAALVVVAALVVRDLQRRQRTGRVFLSAPTLAGLPVESLLTVEQSRQTFADTTVVNSRRVSWEQRVRLATPVRVSYSYSFERTRTFDTAPPDPLSPPSTSPSMSPA